MSEEHTPESIPGFNEAHETTLTELLALKERFEQLTEQIYPELWNKIVNNDFDESFNNKVRMSGLGVQRQIEDAINKIQKKSPYSKPVLFMETCLSNITILKGI
jgi:hypothetical protein